MVPLNALKEEMYGRQYSIRTSCDDRVHLRLTKADPFGFYYLVAPYDNNCILFILEFTEHAWKLQLTILCSSVLNFV